MHDTDTLLCIVPTDGWMSEQYRVQPHAQRQRRRPVWCTVT